MDTAVQRFGHVLDEVAELAAIFDLPPDPFKQTELLGSTLACAKEIIELGARIVEAQRRYDAALPLDARLHRQPYPPDEPPPPPPDDPPPPPPSEQPPPPPTDKGGQK